MPPVVVERPKMTRALWDALKANIMRERERKKQELEANAEVERQRKERERQQKQEAMTLTETREQIGKLDAHLTELKAEKHQLFLQLKKVLNEDEMRRRKEATELMNMNYHNSGGQGQGQQQMGPTAAQMFLQPLTLTRPALYKGGPMPPQHMQHGQPTLIPQGVKRSRSPSPPSHNYRFGPFKPPPHAVHAYPHKPPMGIHYSSSPSSQQQQQQQQQLISVTYPSHHSQPPPPTMFTYPTSGGGNPPSRGDEPPKQIQAHGGIYLGPPSISRGYVLHPMEHGSKFGDESAKYYPPPPNTQMTLLRTGSVGGHMNMHPGLNIQGSSQVVMGYDARNKKDTMQGPISFQGNSSSGSITSGYPIRTTPTGSSFQGRPPSPQIIYAGNSQQRLNYSHPGQLSSSPHAQQQQQGINIPRYSIPPGMQRDRERD